MRSSETKSLFRARLDTGFIARFNERRAADEQPASASRSGSRSDCGGTQLLADGNNGRLDADQAVAKSRWQMSCVEMEESRETKALIGDREEEL